MRANIVPTISVIAAGLIGLLNCKVQADISLIENGRARAVIYVNATMMMADHVVKSAPAEKFAAQQAEQNRRRLRESVKDLATCMEKMSGAKIDVITGMPATGDQRLPILIGDLGIAKFGPLAKSFPYHQAFRVVVSEKAIALIGESDLATSYAIYELLDRLGCRWYMPGEIGEVVPQRKTVALAEMDFTSAPSTVYRGAFGDEAFLRRNRMGGMPVLLGFGTLEKAVTAEQRQQHPDWVARIDGKPHPLRLRWSNPQVADAIADRLIDAQEHDHWPSQSLFPGGGTKFDESPEDRAIDAGDIDPLFGRVSVSDRMLVLANRVARRVAAKWPDLLVMVSAYSLAVRAPVREHAEPQLAPVIVPSLYDRAHPMTDPASPTGALLRQAIEGWAKASRAIGYYAYTFNQAEPTAPNPMIARWSIDLPFILENKCLYWTPEGVGNYEAGLPGLFLEMRLAFNAKQNPADVIDDLMHGFYGNAAKEMSAYWSYIDDAWTQTPVYAGAHFGYTRRFPLSTLKRARELMDAAVAAARTPQEQARVKLADDSLRLFELYMKMRRNFTDGHFEELSADSKRWLAGMTAATKEHAGQDVFTKSGATYFQIFCEPVYQDAAKIASTCDILTPVPLRQWRWHADPDHHGRAAGWSAPTFDDVAWKITDPCMESWANLNMFSYFGDVWYRTRVDLPPLQSGRKRYLWLGGFDDQATIFINGKLGPRVDSKAQQHESFEGFNIPVSVDITESAIGGSNQITILCTRRELNEIGTGGLLGPVIVYSPRQQ